MKINISLVKSIDDGEDIHFNFSVKEMETVMDMVVELHASKATEELRKQLIDLHDRFSESTGKFRNEIEELRKENEALKRELSELKVDYDTYQHYDKVRIHDDKKEIERLNESNKVKDEAINGLREFNNTQDERWREYSKKLEDSNKELVEALRNAVVVYKKYANDNSEEDHIFNHCEELILKSGS